MFWGCFSKREMGPLVPVEGIITAKKYKELMEKYLLPIFKKSNYQLIFMQDNAPIHKAKLVTDFLAHHGIPTLEWPAQSPDLNPIENMWAVLKARRARQKLTPKTRKDLIEQMSELWSTIEENFRENLSNSIPKRLSEVITNKGKATSY
jgi:transposase